MEVVVIVAGMSGKPESSASKDQKATCIAIFFINPIITEKSFAHPLEYSPFSKPGTNSRKSQPILNRSRLNFEKLLSKKSIARIVKFDTIPRHKTMLDSSGGSS
jgi:hypothetical protein